LALALAALAVGMWVATWFSSRPPELPDSAAALAPYGQAGLLAGLEAGGSGAAVGVGQPVPEVVLADLRGDTARLSNLRGRPVVLNFWATWCPPCVAEMPLLQSIYDRERDNGLLVVGINLSEPSERVSAYLERNPVTYPIWVDPADAVPEGSATQDAFQQFGGVALPTTYFIDADGTMVEQKLGELDAEGLDRVIETIRGPEEPDS